MIDLIETIEYNGIIRPRRGTLADEAWTLFDELGRNFPVAIALKAAQERKLNPNNIRTELCRWRRFHGIRM